MINPAWMDRIRKHLEVLYPTHDHDALVREVVDIFAPLPTTRETATDGEPWSQRDAVLLTYGDSLHDPCEPPLETLRRFLEKRVGDAINCVHILPFFPYSSDDGFAVIDHLQVNPELGDWTQIKAIGQTHHLMFDLVINHVSSKHRWFQNYQRGESPGKDYFIEVNPEADLSTVVRPRTSPLLRATETDEGTRYVWCTFSHDQIDLDFSNPRVLVEILKIIAAYLHYGARIIRLDAIGYLWKRLGTACIHLAETHEAVRLIRTILEAVAPGTWLITETNVPNHENLTYFGNRNEAHVIYNFSLAPLILHALLSGKAQYLQRWMRSMPPAPVGCTYLNFTASHDGIGMRPAEGLLSEEDQQQVISTVQSFGGLVSTRRLAEGGERVYELNISFFDALQGTVTGPDGHQIARFLCSQTIAMGIEGIPAIYIHSLLATPNDLEGVRQTGRNRSINRHRWDAQRVESLLEDPESATSQVHAELLRRLRLRAKQPAFHPAATQFTLVLEHHFFGFWRQSTDRRQSIFAIHNLSNQPRVLPLEELNLISTDHWHDLLSDQTIGGIYATIELQPYQCLWLSNYPR